MKTLFLLDRHDLAELRSGKPFDLALGNGTIVTLQAERPVKAQPVSMTRYAAEHGVAATSKHFNVSEATVYRRIKKTKRGA